MTINGSTVLVTGGTGSFGKKFVEVLLRDYHPRVIRIFSRDELKQLDMQRDARFSDERLRFFLGDVRDSDRLQRAMEGVDLVVHAAAMKQVPSCESNPFEAVRTNVLGAQNVIEAALNLRVPRVLSLSTDKAVNPANLYGATKLCAEKMFTAASWYVGDKDSRFTCVRYGNVLGSRGSVVPLFLSQRATGVVTITDARMTRFWITLEQAAAFVISCIGRMRGGEIMVPKIPTARITDLVHVLAPDAQVHHIGIRQGEKLHEVLLTEDEARIAREFDGFYVVEPQFPGQLPHRWLEGRPLPDGFRYSSDTNPWQLSRDELRAMLGPVTPERGAGVEAGPGLLL